jgi:uncharacterized protein (TIGR02266 family)
MFGNFRRRATRTVFIVTENPAELALGGAFLQQPDIRLLTSYPDDEALRIARRERPGLIVEDLDGLDGAGMAFHRRLRSDPATRAIPLILLTNPELREATELAGADVLLEKPLAQGELFRAVRRFLPLPDRSGRRLATNLRFIFTVAGQEYQAFSRDVSESGVFLKTDRIPPLGTKVEVCFRLPGSWNEIRCTGHVRNTAGGEGHGQVGGIGVEFDTMEDVDREVLENFVERNTRRRTG